jgi:conjugative transposon TraN protein
MKKLLYSMALILMAITGYAQNTLPDNYRTTDQVKKYQLPVIYLPADVSLHFISPEPIQYVDISTKHVIGDLPLKNVLRIKQAADTSGKRLLLAQPEDAVITIAGEKFIAQYHVVFADVITARDAVTDINITPSDCRPLDISGIGLSQPQLKNLALNLFSRRAGKNKEHTKAFGIKGMVNHIYTAGDYLFLDLGYENKTNLRYDVDETRFKVDDKKVTKATNVQSVEIKPEFVLFDESPFKKTYRNIYVFKKLTFPGNKVLHIELSEKQMSGRIITLNVSYQDVLDADIIPLK